MPPFPAQRKTYDYIINRSMPLLRFSLGGHSSNRSAVQPQRKPTFDEILASTDMPPQGPAYFAARRALWLNPRTTTTTTTQPSRTAEQSSSRQRLESLLNRPGAVNDEGVWKSGVEKVWKGLTGGVRLKRRLPLALVIKVIHAAWMRDPNTWPSGAVVPESDEAIEESVVSVSVSETLTTVQHTEMSSTPVSRCTETPVTSIDERGEGEDEGKQRSSETHADGCP